MLKYAISIVYFCSVTWHACLLFAQVFQALPVLHFCHQIV